MNTPVTIPSWVAALAIVAIIMAGVVCVNLHYGSKARIDKLEKQVQTHEDRLEDKVNVSTYQRHRKDEH